MYSDQQQFDYLCQVSLFSFTWMAFNVLYPGGEFVPSWHVQVMAQALQDCLEGRCSRLLITVPPRHLKSIAASVALPAFWLGRDPTSKLMVASYGGELAAKHGRDFRTVLQSPEYQRLFPRTRVDPNRNNSLEVMTTERGHRMAVSVGGTVTGLGSDILIIDDLMKAADAQSPTERMRVKEFYEQTLYSRLNNKKHAIIIAIQQRLHEDDLAAYLIDKGFTHLNLRAIAEDDETHPIEFGLVHRRNKGEPLFPERESLDTLDTIRREIGPYAFGAQYQQNPTPPDGNALRWEWFGTYDDRPDRSELLAVCQSWDTAYSPEPTADFSVCTTWGLTRDNRWLLLDVWRDRVDYPSLKKMAKWLARNWGADELIIEKAGSGISLLSELHKEGPTFCGRLHAYKPREDKPTRFAAQTAKIADGLIDLPREATWLRAFRHEMQAFPNGRNDDQVDSVAQFLDWLGRGGHSRIAFIRNGRQTVRRDVVRK